MKTPRTLVAMSGGVDSSIAAALMLHAKHECAGITMVMQPEQADTPTGPHSCIAAVSPAEAVADTESTETGTPAVTSAEIADAQQVCALLGIPHYTLDVSAEFSRRVIQPFVEGYLAGYTPNPCIACNRYLKFGLLLAWAAEQGFDTVATGHYARIAQGRLFRARDTRKDQSYVLYTLTATQLNQLSFPLGDYTKEEVRACAAARGFVNANRQESQDICFIPQGDYASFIESYLCAEEKNAPSGSEKSSGSVILSEAKDLSQASKKALFVKDPSPTAQDDRIRYISHGLPSSSALQLPRPGTITTLDGTVVGTHEGIHHFTIGQRRGLGIPGPEPYYVVDIDAASATVVIGTREEQGRYTALINEVNIIIPGTVTNGQRVTVRHRYQGREHQARVFIQEGNTAKIAFEEKQPDLTRGQALVLYNGDCVLGGGTIVATQ